EKNLTEFTEFYLVGFQSSKLFIIFLFCFTLVIYFGTICGNLLIIVLVSTSRSLHTPMYFFISQLSVTDILLTTNIVPNMLHVLLHNGGAITFAGCMTQLYFFCASETFECFLLTVMSYDRYLAICDPLRYTSIMTNTNCVKLGSASWLFGFFCAFLDTLTILMLTFCGPNTIDHFFCDIVPLIEIACSGSDTVRLEIYILSLPVLFIPITIIVISYINIIVTIIRLHSGMSRQKAFSTCSSHLIVVSIFYFTPLSVYVFPTGGQTLNISKILSLLYTVFTPFINPIIYSLRNRDIAQSLQDIITKIWNL
ncbi:hypothetical protein GDO81_027767, partial [Engystomops pustulosus]